MGNLKKLAGHTIIYGLSSILARFINYLLNPLYTNVFKDPNVYGIYTEYYTYIPFLLVLLTFGMETGYFKFSNKYNEAKDKTYSTSFTFLLLTSSIFLAYTLFDYNRILSALDLTPNKWYLILTAWIVFLDVIMAIPFARLRSENKATLFALFKTINIIINVVFNLLLILVLPSVFSWFPDFGIASIFIANLIASLVTLFIVLRYAGVPKISISRPLLKEMLYFSIPLVIAGLAGNANDLLDRLSIKYLIPADQNPMYQLGIYGSNIKLAVVITLFTQMFRFAAEPFFFSNASRDSSYKTYADVFKYFSVFSMIIFLMVTLYIDIFQYLEGKDYRVGLSIVPTLLLSYYFSGLLFNLQMIFKLENATKKTVVVTFLGFGCLLLFNVMFVPRFGYSAAAWGRLLSFLIMCVLSYLIGRKLANVPYNFKSILFYFFFGLLIYAVSLIVKFDNTILRLAINTLLFCSYIVVFLYKEKINPITVVKSLLRWK